MTLWRCLFLSGNSKGSQWEQAEMFEHLPVDKMQGCLWKIWVAQVPAKPSEENTMLVSLQLLY